MRELSERDIGFVSGGTGDPDLVLPTVRVTAPRGSGVSPFYSIQAMHADGGGGFGANLLLAQAIEPEEAPLVMDPIIVRPGDNTSEDDSSVYCSDGGAWQEQDEYGNVWRGCLNDDGTVSYEFIRQIFVS